MRQSPPAGVSVTSSLLVVTCWPPVFPVASTFRKTSATTFSSLADTMLLALAWAVCLTWLATAVARVLAMVEAYSLRKLAPSTFSEEVASWSKVFQS